MPENVIGNAKDELPPSPADDSGPLPGDLKGCESSGTERAVLRYTLSWDESGESSAVF